jgi:hypothetical protein
MEGDRVSVDQRFVIEHRGKSYALYAGLLDAAHRLGLRSIEEEIVQAPDASHDAPAIVKATVEMEDGRRFSGIGDASPDNVGRGIAPHLLRMASTRAKARALRDAINVGVTAFEELGGEEEPQRQEEPERTLGGATRKAAGKLWMLAGGKDVQAVQAFEANAGKEIKDMNAKEVSEWIGRLS